MRDRLVHVLSMCGRWGARIAAAGMTLLALEAMAAVFRPVPFQPEFDATGLVGDGQVARRWLVLGDSSTTAPGVSGPDEIWIRQLARLHPATGATEITSLAVGGSRTRDVRDHQLPLIDPETRFDVVFVSVGANDVIKGEPVQWYRTALDDVVGLLARRHRRVVLSGVGDLSTIPRLWWPLDRIVGSRGRRFDGIAAEVADRHGAIKVDHWNETASAFRNDPDIFSPDGFHPGPRGHRVWAEAVDRLLRQTPGSIHLQ